MIAIIAFILTSSLSLTSGYSLNVSVSKLAVGETHEYSVNSFQEYIIEITNLTNVSIALKVLGLGICFYLLNKTPGKKLSILA